MLRSNFASVLLCGFVLTLGVGCAPSEDIDAEGASAEAVSSRPCPEPVWPDFRNDPRNAAGQIRFCWPGEALCHCDSDNDCYRLEGHVACTPVTSGAADSGRDTGVRDTGVRDTGVRDTGVRDTGVTDTGVRDAGVADTGVSDVVTSGGAPTVPPTTGIAAFPGAEGFGANATGGRGGRVVFVTNLNASGPGSLQDALDQTGARTILFRVSGVINAPAHLAQGNVTIAGQTSPGGIIVRGIDTTEEPYCDQNCGVNARGVENFIIRHLRSRPAGGSFPDGLRLRYARNGIVDHVSIGNASDEAVEVSYANNITVQESILAETVGSHANYGGILMNYTNPAAGYGLDRIALLRNSLNRLMGRYPELSRESGSAAANTTMNLEMTNNLLWDQSYFIDVNPTNISGGNSGSAILYAINWIGNASVSRSGNRFGMIWMQNPTGRSSAYFNDNRSNLWATRADWDLNYCCSDYSGAAGTRPTWARSARHDFPQVTTMPASQVRAYAAASNGAFPRDPMDRRLMDFVARNVLDTRSASTNPAGDALRQDFTAANAPAAPVDSDNDGMPNAWETARGLNPNVADNNGTGLSRAMTGVDGYTNLECYLNELSMIRVRDNR